MISGTSNGEVAVKGFKELEKQTGLHLMDLAEGNEERRITFPMTQAAPQPVMTSPSGPVPETGGRRYAPFTVNIEKKKPFHTPDRPYALLPRPRLDARNGRGSADLPSAAGYDRPVTTSPSSVLPMVFRLLFAT